VKVYTDSLEFAGKILGALLDWKPASGAPGEPLEGRVLEAFYGDRPVQTARLEGGDPWAGLVMVGSAPRSHLDTIGALSAGGAALPDGLLCLAASGRGFRGQRDRGWVATAGNLHLCAYFQARLPVSRAGVGFSLLPALAVLDALDRTPGLEGRAGIKWVNDILVEGAKVAGVLARTRCSGEEVNEAILGVGINVEVSPEVARDPFVPQVACLRDFAPACRLGEVWREVIDALEGRYRTLRDAGPGPLLEDYRRRCLVLGRRVSVRGETSEEGAEEIATGRVTGIGDGLELHLEGVAEPVTKGRLVLLD